jgi:hypothetical protein
VRLPIIMWAALLLGLVGCTGAVEHASTPTPSGATTRVSQSPSPDGQFAAALQAALQEGKALRGLSETDAKVRATTTGFVFRIVKRDGHALPVFNDLVPMRIDVVVDHGVVVTATAG